LLAVKSYQAEYILTSSNVQGWVLNMYIFWYMCTIKHLVVYLRIAIQSSVYFFGGRKSWQNVSMHSKI